MFELGIRGFIALALVAWYNFIMHGVVDQNCEATIRLVVGDAGSQRQLVDVVIDTGFTGFLTLPLSVLSNLNLQPYRREPGTLGMEAFVFLMYTVALSFGMGSSDKLTLTHLKHRL